MVVAFRSVYRRNLRWRCAQSNAEFMARLATRRKRHTQGVVYPAARARLLRSDRRLGLDCCAVCARRKVLVACRACGRVRYCSKACLQTDKPIHEGACILLRQTDEAEGHASSSSRIKLLAPETVKWLLGHRTLVRQSWVAALIAADPKAAELSHVELSVLSYPLSAAWAASLVPELVPDARKVLVLGAGPAEAAVPASCWAAALGRCELVLVGPELPANARVSADNISVVYRRERYVRRDDYALVIGFNLGLTCPDYDWSDALLPRDATLAFFTNTEPELAFDLESPLLRRRVPNLIARNLFHCPRWRQSTTIANDLYRKHSWLALFEPLNGGWHRPS
ncbi:hypothetical protein CTAYLR_001719 [Chrysophaeum taylorii]|uniref:MYND-type domain-containing protein n=1 Tax=Chrysophaeum taylorii TaxID=2483200 RepID=A0AAD7U5G1_9STRA|nr:hypothetical protein CTAYLR_001719 [Chrysophaeum taylorii]